MRQIIFLLTVVTLMSSCGRSESYVTDNIHIIFNKTSAGYTIDITRIPNGWLYHFKRGDSIDCYIPLALLPQTVQALVNAAPSDTCIHTDMEFPLKEKMFGKFFFMDATFDGEPEFVVGLMGHDYLEFICYNITETKEGHNGVTINYVQPMDFTFFGYYGLHRITDADFDADSTYLDESILQILTDGPHFDGINMTVNMFGLSGSSGSFEYQYQYIGNGQYLLLQYKDRESVPIFEEGVGCVEVYTLERTYKPHPIVKDSLILVSEMKCD